MRKISIGLAGVVLAVTAWAALPSANASAQTLPSCLPELNPDGGGEPPPADDDNCDEVGNPNEGGNPGTTPFYPQPTPTAAAR